jgi:hypothetical protein
MNGTHENFVITTWRVSLSFNFLIFKHVKRGVMPGLSLSLSGTLYTLSSGVQ